MVIQAIDVSASSFRIKNKRLCDCLSIKYTKQSSIYLQKIGWLKENTWQRNADWKRNVISEDYICAGYFCYDREKSSLVAAPGKENDGPGEQPVPFYSTLGVMRPSGS